MARNYLEVYPYDKWASSSVPDFQENEQFMPSVLEVKDGKTTRPNLLTEADLVGLMDRNGIGQLPKPGYLKAVADRQGLTLRSRNISPRSSSVNMSLRSRSRGSNISFRPPLVWGWWRVTMRLASTGP
jgi:DNA topoisomerase-3